MTKEQAVEFVKTNAPGYIGGQEIIQKATNEEIIYLIELQDKIAGLINEAEELERRKDNLKQAIQRR